MAQPGSALRSGRRGRGFESRLPDKQKSQPVRWDFLIRYYPMLINFNSKDALYHAPTKISPEVAIGKYAEEASAKIQAVA